MAGQEVNTLKCEVRLDALEAALDRVDYAHGMAGLLTEQRDFEKLPQHQQAALNALLAFTFEAKNALSDLIKH